VTPESLVLTRGLCDLPYILIATAKLRELEIMTSKVETRLNEMGITIPDAPAPAANYVPYVVSGNLVFVSGQVPFVDGKLTATGTVGKDATPEDATEQARICAINLIAQVKVACDGDLDRVTRVVKLGAFVASADDFNGQPGIVNGASDLMVEAFGDAGRHARFAVGTNALPLNCLVEIDGVFEIK
jgi:enamine deaminase RidA (YjgF/YER057c/UK114 family)